ncbi:MAG: PspC domain-containing protein [Nocardioides sp.]
MTTDTPGPPAPASLGPIAPEPQRPPPRDALRRLADLRRSRSDKKIAGVAGGLARDLDIDPIIVRVLLVVLIFFGGSGLIVYVGCWLLVPIQGSAQATVRLDERSRGFAVAIVGGIAALALLGDSLGGWGLPWPLAIIGAIVAIVLLSRGRRARPRPERRPEEPALSYPPARDKRRGPLLFPYAVALIAVGIGILGIVDLAGASVIGSAYGALALTISAALLVLGAFWGRPGGLILLGVLSAVTTAASVGLGELEVGRFSSGPLTSAELRSDYDVDIGEIDLDLNEVRDLEALDGRRIDLEVGVGQVKVLVPEGLGVRVVSDLGAGDSTIFGIEDDGGTATGSLDAGVDAPSLTLYVTVGLGDIEIARAGGR